jgi:hypothetical protein
METPMVDFPALSFEAVAYKFGQRGVVIKSLPGEYSIGYLNEQSGASEFRATLAEAIEIAEFMACEAPANTARSAAGYRRKRRVSMTPKAIIKRRIKAHKEYAAQGTGVERAAGDGGRVTADLRQAIREHWPGRLMAVWVTRFFSRRVRTSRGRRDCCEPQFRHRRSGRTSNP